ncbi:MAG TPA: Lrp/AsnC family transcriptional regulator [Candidatus Binatia bacterium]|nr:Lrp/AsnC family transcriptional regulator [Candidatus Binatia bacterium]
MDRAPDLDSYDLHLLEALQHDGRLSNVELGNMVHLSASQVSRRVARLIAEGYIQRFQAVLDPRRVGIGLTAYCLVTLKIHSEGGMEDFHRRVKALPEILECQALTGEADYLIKIAVADLKGFSEFLAENLMRAPEVATVRSSIVLDSVKSSNEYSFDGARKAQSRHAP